MPSSEIKSSLNDYGTISPTSGQAGANGGPLPSGSDAQNIQTYAFRNVPGSSSANVDGSFTAGMKPDFPGSSPAGGSARPGSEVFSSYECGHDKVSSKSTSGGGSVKSSMSY